MKRRLFYCLGLIVFLSACTVSKKSEVFTPFPTIAAEITPLSTATQAETVLPTSEPMAVLVNGAGITLSEFEAELLRYQAAKKTNAETLTPEEKQRVLNELIQQLLLAEWARENGYESSEEAIQQHLTALIQESGGEQSFREWLQQNHYDEHSFKVALERNLAAAWARDKIAAQVPTTADQIHARQIFFYDLATAQQTLSRLKNGEVFETIAAEFDPLTGGDLGWFPQGYALEPEIDEAIFGKEGSGGLKVDDFSEIVQTRLGFHILKVIAIEEQRPLSTAVLLKAQQQALQKVLQELMEKSTIEVLIH